MDSSDNIALELIEGVEMLGTLLCRGITSWGVGIAALPPGFPPVCDNVFACVVMGSVPC
jgi:hypothetical protein